MQVSWIDSEHLKSLLHDLGEVRPEKKSEPVKQAEAGQETDAYTPPLGLVETAPVAQKLHQAPAKVALAEPVVAKRLEPTVVARSDDEDAVDGGDEIVAPEVERIRDRLRAVRERAEAAGLLRRVAAPAAVSRVSSPVVTIKVGVEAGEMAAVAEPVFQVPKGSIAERLEFFAGWVGKQLVIDELLLLDEQGDMLWGAEARADLVLSVMLAARAASRSNAAQAVVGELPSKVSHQTLGEGKGTLSVLPCPTEQGLVVLGIESTAPVSERQGGWLAAALKATVEGPA